jgi:hypothetical protein
MGTLELSLQGKRILRCSGGRATAGLTMNLTGTASGQ